MEKNIEEKNNYLERKRERVERENVREAHGRYSHRKINK